jgi:hypothetical protein
MQFEIVFRDFRYSIENLLCLALVLRRYLSDLSINWPMAPPSMADIAPTKPA